MLSTNCLSFPPSENLLNSPHSQRIFSLDIGNLWIDRVFCLFVWCEKYCAAAFFSHGWEIYFQSYSFPSIVIVPFSMAVVMIFFFVISLSSLIRIYFGIDYFVFSLFVVLSASWICTFMSWQVFDVLSYYIFKCFFNLKLFLLYYWDSDKINSRSFIIFSQVSDALLIFL